ncbi:TetR/AcrR family transcriptional regulator [Amycolatopsis benzoatilytica]|uniref:TetR/AcrR family transcriptional regulator n=1 Tax=Amycolatopsis benzoatilytica TaxID=346045 RepID=UPI00035C7EB8|nr:TetR/AcrR family transcriptional regulator [Amycolatopsis benzoatilytica]
MVRAGGSQLRGAELSRHILLSAKNVFLEVGFERASMDAVAARAGTSKRSLYAHFESKDKLFLAVLDLVRELYLGKLRTPGDYAADPVEAVTLFCGRFQQLLTWEPQVRTCRLSISAVERLPDSAQAYYDAMFASMYARLAEYLAERYEKDSAAAMALAEDLVGRTVLARVFRVLLNAEPAIQKPPGEDAAVENVDLAPIRRVVSAVLS